MIQIENKKKVHNNGEGKNSLMFKTLCSMKFIGDR